MLNKARAQQELSIADYIALHGQPQQQRGMPTRPGMPGNVEVNLSHTNITSLYGINQIENPEAIQTLELSNNAILGHKGDPEFPQQPFAGFNNLEVLDLRLNKLQTLPKNIFQQLNRLEILTLDNNQLQTLPENIFQGLDRLTHLYLYNNQLQTLSENIFKALYTLETLSIENNQLQTLPEYVFQDLINVRDLGLSGNQFPESTLELRRKHHLNTCINIR